MIQNVVTKTLAGNMPPDRPARDVESEVPQEAPIRVVGPGDSYGRSLKAINTNHPDDFDDMGEPYKVVQWLTHMEKLFRGVVCTDIDKVNITALRLKGDGGIWWESARFSWEVTPTWETFKEIVIDHYF